MRRFDRQRAGKYLHWALAIALFLTAHAAHGQSKPSSQTTPARTRPIPKRGAIYVDVITDSTGAVVRLDFLNKVPAEVQEWIRKKTLGRHFGVPNHSYRRHVLYEVSAPATKR